MRWFATALALVLLGSLVACGGGGGGAGTVAEGEADENDEAAGNEGAAAGDEGEVVELTFRQFDPPGEIGGLEQAVERFNSENPEIQVEIETVAVDEALNSYVREVQAGGGPDVVQVQFVWPKDLAAENLLLDLGPLHEAEPLDEDPEDFLGSDLTILDGTTWAVPWTADTFAMAYRPDLLEEAGIDSFPETWEELQGAAATLTKDGQFGFCFPAASSPQSGIWFLANYYLWSNGRRWSKTARAATRSGSPPRRPPM